MFIMIKGLFLVDCITLYNVLHKIFQTFTNEYLTLSCVSPGCLQGRYGMLTQTTMQKMFS